MEIGCQARGFCCELSVEQDDIDTGIGIKDYERTEDRNAKVRDG